MKLDVLLKGLKYQIQQGSLEKCEISGLCEDSRRIKENDLFFCRIGAHTNAKRYLRQAILGGASAVVCDAYDEENSKLLENAHVCAIKMEINEQVQAKLASNFYKFPQEKLLLIGVTGTKGKTTVAAMLQKLFFDNGIKSALVGTNGFFTERTFESNAYTTPELFDMYRYMAIAVSEGCSHFIVEASSLAVKQGRLSGLFFELGIFTNLHHDHISVSEHSSMKEYAYWKKAFFKSCKNVLLNRDEELSYDIAAERNVCSWYSVKVPSDGYAENIQNYQKEDGLYQCFIWHWKKYKRKIIMKLPGTCNVSNAAAALSAFGMLTKEWTEEIKTDFSTLEIEGRFQIAGHFHDGLIVIDYAHNEISLKNLLETMREYSSGKVICMFGCGGERSVLRRKAMGKISSELADMTIITQDNPRGEPFESIASDILSGVNGSCIVIRDRKDAIEYCMERMDAGDILVLAGKGHETVQKIGSKSIPFSELDIVREYIRTKGENSD